MKLWVRPMRNQHCAYMRNKRLLYERGYYGALADTLCFAIWRSRPKAVSSAVGRRNGCAAHRRRREECGHPSSWPSGMKNASSRSSRFLRVSSADAGIRQKETSNFGPARVKRFQYGTTTTTSLATSPQPLFVATTTLIV